MRNGQIEMVGLVFLVVLLVLGGLFYLKFVVLQPPAPGVVVESESQARNFLYGMIHVPLCQNQTTLEVIHLCSTQGETACGNACQTLQQELPHLFTPVFTTVFHTNYTFTAQENLQQPAFFTLGKKCSLGGTKVSITPQYEDSSYRLALELCDK